MTDKELLELAAKAAGLRLSWHDWGDFGQQPMVSKRDEVCAGPTTWNPLTDDGNALRLAVDLHLWFRPLSFSCPEGHEVQVSLGGDGVMATEKADGDPRAATRRAIVRAAARIGKAMP